MKKLLAVLLLLVVYPAYGQDYTVTPVEVRPPLENMNITGGTNLNLADDGMATNINIGFDFEFYGNIFNKVNISNNGFITFTGLNSACCQGNPLPSPFMDNSIMALWTDLISINNVNPYYKTDGELGSRYFTVGWYNTLEFYNTDATNTFEITLYEGSNNILFNYENLHIFGHTLTAGIQGTDGQSEQLYYGNSPQSLAYSAYLFEYTPPEPETPIAPDCTINPASTSCIINTNTTAPVYVAEETNNTQSETFVADVFEPQVIGGIPPDLESLLSDNQTTDLADEETEKELSDDITTNILEQVLAVTETTEIERKDRSIGISEETTENTVALSVSETSVESTIETDIQVTNVAETYEETSVVENVIESVETSSVDNTYVEETQMAETVENVLVVESTYNTVEYDNQTVYEETEILVENNTETIIEETVEQTVETVELPVFVQTINETLIENISIDNNDSGDIQEETLVANQVEQSIQIDSELTNEAMSISVAQSENDIKFVETVVSEIQQQSTFSDDTTEDEQLTMAYVQPGSGIFTNNNLFNVEPNITDKEVAGVLGKVEEKSDAEKRAEEVVAANKEQQDEINKNYMEADQSGIVAAIGADTDVSSYRSAMLRDNNIWYKPEDIYKNIVYKDNVRGAYFLEKGNTDTYKKMVEEQYK